MLGLPIYVTAVVSLLSQARLAPASQLATTLDAPTPTPPPAPALELELALGEPDLEAGYFARVVRPLLSDRCFACHAGEHARALRLDVREDAVDDLGGAAIIPGDAPGSALWRRITHEDPARRMPPSEAKLELNDAERAVLRRWIEGGAPYEEHWAYVRPERTAPPDVEHEGWVRDPLDRYVLAGLERAGLTPAPEADPATLLRRVHYDLTGLPPTVDEVRAFLAAPTDAAYEAVVDRLLASPEHAEHMAAGWLDVARYAETFGYQSDVEMNVWPWRDWVVRAFEADLPYDDFVTWQLAGDLLEGAPNDARLATTFNRLHRQTNEGGSVEEEFRVQYVCDRVETMAAAFLGVTFTCARCHDHKFDPFTQRDYYNLFAFFDGIDESGLYSHFTNATPTPALDLASAEQIVRLEALDARVAAAEVALEAAQSAHSRLPAPTHAFELHRAELPSGVNLVDAPARCAGPDGSAFRMSGEDALTFPGAGVFARSDAFSISLDLRAPKRYERAVVLHRAKAWTDSGSRGYQLLIEDGRLSVALVHFWPGDAIAIRAVAPLEVGVWRNVTFTYDGSSRAAGLALYVDGARVETEVVRDHLTRTIQGGGIEHLTIGSRFRDNGFAGGEVGDLRVYARALDADAVAIAAQRGGAAQGAPDPSDDAAREALRAARRERDALRDSVRQIMTMREAPAELQRTAYVLQRGSYEQRREAAQPATPAALPRLLDAPARTRLDLARWLVHPDHPLTARVQVDRLWRTVFGAGLLPRPDDVGYQSPAPVQRALLDALARDFVDGTTTPSGARSAAWDNRALLRRCVMSATYRQASRVSPAARERDPDNALLSRASARRLPAESLRDGILRAAGILCTTRGGPAVRPYQPPGLWEEKSGKVYTPSHGDDLRRRSLYTFWRRTSPPPTLTLLNAPSREVCTVERELTESPLQTLALWNDPQFVEAAVRLAQRAIEATAPGLGEREADAARIERLFLALASRPPTPAELAAAEGLLDAQRAAYRADPAAAQALATYDLERVAHPGAAPEGAAPTEAGTPDAAARGAEDSVDLAATAVLASALLTLDDVVTRR
ncbi:MAG: DUF1549 domain-containing protein [Planctomycetota bacterium]